MYLSKEFAQDIVLRHHFKGCFKALPRASSTVGQATKRLND
ncbi:MULTISPECIES: hypothetical protein [Moraxella]|uniref:Uncharacterized protein n=1 Tax=Moraxella catarrhalis TaxID=480 RepID=A0A7Z0UWX0_MORCA|nr:hypothetical protein [Moraxella catarrhalis]OAU99419.1 hypothetical protein AO382_2064 [Moraxella catarrhalis]